jgi:hypothetical protein
VVAVSGPIEAVPLGAVLFDQPPSAVQDVASVELHVSVELAPLATYVGLAVSATVGGGGPTVIVTD